MSPFDNIAPVGCATAPRFAAPGHVGQPDLESTIWACLKSQLPDAHALHLAVVGSTAVLRGAVPSPREKRLYVECLRSVPGITRVVDDLTLTEQGHEPAP